MQVGLGGFKPGAFFFVSSITVIQGSGSNIANTVPDHRKERTTGSRALTVTNHLSFHAEQGGSSLAPLELRDGQS